jgi:hypothetical protein
LFVYAFLLLPVFKELFAVCKFVRLQNYETFF